MNLHNLKAFLKVAQLSSISDAAQQLHLTQPAVTKRIQSLESELNYLLFDRIGKKIVLTESGRYLLPKAEEILQLTEECKQGLTDLEEEVSGELKLITSHHVGLHRLPNILRHYKNQFPKVDINIKFQNSTEIYQSILTCQGDLGITTNEEIHNVALLATDVWNDPLCFICASHHPLVDIKKLRVEDLVGYPAILPDQNFSTTKLVMELFSNQGLVVKVDEGLRTNFLETIKALVSIGDTWSVLPKSMMLKEVSNDVVEINPEGVQLSRQLICLQHKQRQLNRAAKAFLSILKNTNDYNINVMSQARVS